MATESSNTQSEPLPLEKRLTFDDLQQGCAGARARTKRIAREGPLVAVVNARCSEMKRNAAQYRADVALMWDDERIRNETGWSLQRFLAAKRHVEQEDRDHYANTNPLNVFATYQEQQFQCVRELEDLAEIFRGSRQYSATYSNHGAFHLAILPPPLHVVYSQIPS